MAASKLRLSGVDAAARGIVLRLRGIKVRPRNALAGKQCLGPLQVRLGLGECGAGLGELAARRLFAFTSAVGVALGLVDLDLVVLFAQPRQHGSRRHGIAGLQGPDAAVGAARLLEALNISGHTKRQRYLASGQDRSRVALHQRRLEHFHGGNANGCHRRFHGRCLPRAGRQRRQQQDQNPGFHRSSPTARSKSARASQNASRARS